MIINHGNEVRQLGLALDAFQCLRNEMRGVMRDDDNADGHFFAPSFLLVFFLLLYSFLINASYRSVT